MFCNVLQRGVLGLILVGVACNIGPKGVPDEMERGEIILMFEMK